MTAEVSGIDVAAWHPRSTATPPARATPPSAQDGHRLVHHPRSVLHEVRQIVGGPGGGRNSSNPATSASRGTCRPTSLRRASIAHMARRSLAQNTASGRSGTVEHLDGGCIARGMIERGAGGLHVRHAAFGHACDSFHHQIDPARRLSVRFCAVAIIARTALFCAEQPRTRRLEVSWCDVRRQFRRSAVTRGFASGGWRSAGPYPVDRRRSRSQSPPPPRQQPGGQVAAMTSASSVRAIAGERAGAGWRPGRSLFKSEAILRAYLAPRSDRRSRPSS